MKIKLFGDILRLNGYKFKIHDIWISKGINIMKVENHNKLLFRDYVKIFKLKQEYISWYQFQ